MSEATSGTKEPTRRFFAVAVSAHDALPPLPGAEADANALARMLEQHHGYRGEVLQNPSREQLEEHLAPDSLSRADLIVYWIGHGRRGGDGSLQLLGSKANSVLASAAELGTWVMQTGASQVLLLLDTCHSGSGLVNALSLAYAEVCSRNRTDAHWFGVLAASRAEEEARAGALVQVFSNLLEHGPRQLDARWTTGQPQLRGDDVLKALAEEWGQSPHAEYQSVMPMNFGTVQRPMLRNPRFDVSLGAQPVEHLLQAARGGSDVESFFTGRTAPLGRIVGWMRQQRPGLLVVIGPAGCGKSALLGRVTSLSLPEERERLLHTAAPVPELDPGASSVHAQLALRGVTVDSAAERLARQLGADPAQGLYGVLASAHERLERGTPLVVVLDGLDEAGAQAAAVADELLRPLATQALVLVSARRVDFGGTSLTALHGVDITVVNLEQDHTATLQDVRAYVIRRLAGVAPKMDPARVSDALTSGLGGDATAPFLLAQLITSQLRQTPLDTSAEGWEHALVTSAQSALEQDMHRVVLMRDGNELPDGARELMAALAWAEGPGFPADDLWPEIATRLSRHGTRYTRDDAYALLGELGRHIVASVEEGQQVYRIAHRVLVDYLRVSLDTASPMRVAQAASDTWAAWMAAGHAPQAHGYLWSFGWQHMADAGAEGMALLEQLASGQRALFLLDLALAYEFAAERAEKGGRFEAAVAWHEQAVACRRELGDPRRLASALFRLSLVLGTVSQDDRADAAAAEAAALARSFRSDPQARELLAGTWLARASSLILVDQLDAAQRWARESLEFLTEAGTSADTPLVCLAHALLANLGGLQGQGAAAREHGRRAMEAFDARTDTHGDPALMREVLAAWTFAESMVAEASTRSAAPQQATPVDLRPGLRLLAEHQRTGPLRNVADLATAKGLLCMARTLVLVPGAVDPDAGVPSVAELLQEAVSLTSTECVRANINALMVRGAALGLLAQVSDPVVGRTHLEEAVAALSDEAQVNSRIAFQLGECQNLMTRLDLAEMQKGIPKDARALATRQAAAVAGLRRLAFPPAVAQLINALGQQALLLTLVGELEAATAAREEALYRLRELAPSRSELRLALASLLTDLSASMLPNRTGEALALAEECASIVGPVPNGPAERLLLATALLNQGAALVTLTRLAQARLALETSDQLLADAALMPPGAALAVAAVGANVHLNLASLDLLEDQPQHALVHARRSMALFATPGLMPVLSANAPLAEAVLGQAECATGDTEAGLHRLQQVVAHVRVLVEQQFPASQFMVAMLVRGTDLVAPQLWPEFEEALQTQPALLARMRWARRRPPEAWPELAAELHEALQSAPPEAQRELRAIVRIHRALQPERFDAAWRQANGDVPSWLHLDSAHEWLVIGWWNTTTWPASRDYLLMHPELLEPATDGVLEEIGLDPASSEGAQQRLQLLQLAREQGIDHAYAPILLGSEVERWMDSDDPQGHLAQRPELRRAEIGQWLRENTGENTDYSDAAVFLSVWQLLQRGEEALAFGILEDPALGADLLPAALRSPDVPRLAALAHLVWACAEEDALRRRAALCWAVAEALEASGAALPSWPDELAGVEEVERKELIGCVTDAIANHPTAVSSLPTLVTLVTLVHQVPGSGANPPA